MDWAFQIPLAVAAVVATIGYLFGLRLKTSNQDVTYRSRRELLRVNWSPRKIWKRSLGTSEEFGQMPLQRQPVPRPRGQAQRRLSSRSRLERALPRGGGQSLKPTLHLATQIAMPDATGPRQQSANPTTFPTRGADDPRRALDKCRGMADAIGGQFGACTQRLRYSFSMAIFDIDHFNQVT